MFSFSQRIKLLPLEILIKSIWLLDLLGTLPEKILLVLFIALASLGIAAATQKTFYKSVPYLTEGIINTVYGPSPEEIQYNNILGAKTKREYPYKKNDVKAPTISAKAALVMDTKTNKVLFDQGSEEKLAPASTTKLMTALVALELLKTDDEIKVPGFCTTIEGSKAGFKEGDEISVEKLLDALLVTSAGDAACTLATAQTSYTQFVDLMNSKAAELKMFDTSFTNPIGLDGEDGSHHSTAKNLYLLAKEAMRNDLLRNIVKSKEVEVDGKKLLSTNKLLWEIPQTVGIKTGTTAAAGEVLIYEYKEEPKDVTIIVMGSSDRFSDTKNLLNWTLQNFQWEQK